MKCLMYRGTKSLIEINVRKKSEKKHYCKNLCIIFHLAQNLKDYGNSVRFFENIFQWETYP